MYEDEIIIFETMNILMKERLVNSLVYGCEDYNLNIKVVKWPKEQKNNVSSNS